jgi:hypothetical protein
MVKVQFAAIGRDNADNGNSNEDGGDLPGIKIEIIDKQMQKIHESEHIQLELRLVNPQGDQMYLKSLKMKTMTSLRKCYQRTRNQVVHLLKIGCQQIISSSCLGIARCTGSGFAERTTKGLMLEPNNTALRWETQSFTFLERTMTRCSDILPAMPIQVPGSHGRRINPGLLFVVKFSMSDTDSRMKCTTPVVDERTTV